MTSKRNKEDAMGARSQKRPKASAGRAARAAADRAYLAPALGAPLQDDESGSRSGDIWRDPQLRTMAQEIWRNFKQRGQRTGAPTVVNPAGEWWGAGLMEAVPTSSTAEEIARYRNKLMYRADSLEAALDATLTEIERLGRFVPADAKQNTPPAEAAQSSATPAPKKQRARGKSRGAGGQEPR
jgi:hypothetical protein